jgi:hypothetical protein
VNVLFSLLMLLAPVKLEHAQFTIVKDGMKIGTEDFSIAKRGAGYFVEGKTVIGEMVVSSQMELDDKLGVISYQVSSREGSIRVKVTPPVSELQSLVNGETSTADFRFPDRGIILDDDFFHHYLILMYRVQAGQNSFSVFVPREMRDGTATVRRTGSGKYDLQVGDVRLQATTDADGRLIRLVVPAVDVVVER